MARTLVIHAHPYPRRSRAGRAILSAVADLPELVVDELYERYPDFAIDVPREQRELRDAEVVVWQAPFYWYGVPSLLQHWFEKVLTDGFAYGPRGDALRGKSLQWVTTTGTPSSAYQPAGIHQHTFATFSASVEQTARFCGMRWEPPLVVHGAHEIDDRELSAHGAAYRARLEELSRRSPAGAPADG